MIATVQDLPVHALQGEGGPLDLKLAQHLCQGGLHQPHLLLLHPQPLAQGLQLILSRALTWTGAGNGLKVHTRPGLPANLTPREKLHQCPEKELSPARCP